MYYFQMNYLIMFLKILLFIKCNTTRFTTFYTPLRLPLSKFFLCNYECLYVYDIMYIVYYIKRDKVCNMMPNYVSQSRP